MSHHEHWDGEGYPRGLSGEDIPLPGRLVMVADVFDALTSDRVYRKAWPAEQVLAYIHQYSGKRFDPAVAALLERDDVRNALLAIRARESPRLQLEGDPYGTGRWAASSGGMPARAK